MIKFSSLTAKSVHGLCYGHISRNLYANSILWSGHNKWSTIKHDKMKNDSQRNKITNKIVEQIALAAKTGDKLKLNNMTELALKNNISKKVINNVISKIEQKGGNNDNATTVFYEGVGPGGVSLVIRAQTDNKNRTLGQIRSTFKKNNGNLSSTLHLFNKVGSIKIHMNPNTKEDEIWDKLIEVEGIEDLKIDNDSRTFEITCEPSLTNKISQELLELNFELEGTEIIYVPVETHKIVLENDELIDNFHHFLTILQDNEDVADVYHNLALGNETSN